jgi:hypothetical protein
MRIFASVKEMTGEVERELHEMGVVATFPGRRHWSRIKELSPYSCLLSDQAFLNDASVAPTPEPAAEHVAADLEQLLRAQSALLNRIALCVSGQYGPFPFSGCCAALMAPFRGASLATVQVTARETGLRVVWWQDRCDFLSDFNVLLHVSAGVSRWLAAATDLRVYRLAYSIGTVYADADAMDKRNIY